MENKTGQGTGGYRTKLVDVLPLCTPFAIDVFPIYACNFKCDYCVMSLAPEKRGLRYKSNIMKYDKFCKMIDDVKGFEKKIKMVRFVGNGEPLLHKDIARMVKYVMDSDCAIKTEIITNGSLLNKDLSDALIDARLSQIRISLQGVNEQDYAANCGYSIHFEEFLENIKYLYEHKRGLHINLKIPSNYVETADKVQVFQEMCKGRCDSYSVEEIGPVRSGIDYSKYGFVGGDKSNIISVRGQIFSGQVHICNHPFYLMLVNPDGSVYPCCTFEAPAPMGNAFEENIVNIWGGNKFNGFRRKMLKGVEACGNPCKECLSYIYNMFETDIITDEDAMKLIKKY